MDNIKVKLYILFYFFYIRKSLVEIMGTDHPLSYVEVASRTSGNFFKKKCKKHIWRNDMGKVFYSSLVFTKWNVRVEWWYGTIGSIEMCECKKENSFPK